MMGKRKFVIGVFLGATVGGLLSLLDKDTRTYTKDKLTAVKAGTSYVIKNPSDAVHSVRTAFNSFNQAFSKGAENAINTLEQVETTLEKMTNKNKLDRIE